MNMKNKIGAFATIVAALLCALPQPAQATGKIRAVTVENPKPGEALTVGDTVKINFYLVNLGWNATQDDPSYVNPWYFKYTGPLTGDENLNRLQQIAATKPRLGLWIGGNVREAELVESTPVLADDWDPEGTSRKHYTKLSVQYTVKVGDFALPMQLADMDGGPANGSAPYYLKYGGNPVD